MDNMDMSRISLIHRVNRAIIGLALITYIHFSSGFLGPLAFLPLLAIYPLLTATLGVDPAAGWVRSRLANATAGSGKSQTRTIG